MNTCGTCRACCTVLGVQELKKDDYIPCKHICSQGCSIYSTRPVECGKYTCYWLHNGTLEVRPDRVGIILELTKTTIGLAVVCREVWPNAWDASLARTWAYKVARQHNAFIYVVQQGERKAIFPPWVADLLPLAENLIVYKSWREVEKENKEKEKQQAAIAAERLRVKQKALERQAIRRAEREQTRIKMMAVLEEKKQQTMEWQSVDLRRQPKAISSIVKMLEHRKKTKQQIKRKKKLAEKSKKRNRRK